MRDTLLSLTMVFVLGLTGCFSLTDENSSPTPKDGTNDSATPKNEDSTPKSENSNDKSDGNKMTNKAGSIKPGGFTGNLPDGFERPTDPVGQKMLAEYGAMFVAKGGAVPPPKVVFNNEAEVSAWQSRVAINKESIGGATIELQESAMKSLKAAIAEAESNGARITPRGGSDAGRRDYQGTVKNWESRVNPGLTFWVGKGKVTQADAARIKGLAIPEQISEIFKLEAQGIFFSTGRDKSIIYSVAPPGTSQHISMLALDVTESENPKVRDILAKHGWFQTVISDVPHFTYLGVSESDLPKLGLKKVSNGGRDYWVPEI